MNGGEWRDSGASLRVVLDGVDALEQGGRDGREGGGGEVLTVLHRGDDDVRRGGGRARAASGLSHHLSRPLSNLPLQLHRDHRRTALVNVISFGRLITEWKVFV